MRRPRHRAPWAVAVMARRSPARASFATVRRRDARLGSRRPRSRFALESHGAPDGHRGLCRPLPYPSPCGQAPDQAAEPDERGREHRCGTTIKQAYDLVGRERPLRWVLLVVLALLVSGLEMVGAVLVYTLLALVADPDGAIDLPLVGDLRDRFDGVGDDTLLLWVVSAMAVFFLARAAAKVAAKYVQARIAHNAGARLSTRMFEGYLRWPYPMHLTRTTSELIRNGHQAVMEAIGEVVLPTIPSLSGWGETPGSLQMLARARGDAD
jgi:hypothetical protein